MSGRPQVKKSRMNGKESSVLFLFLFWKKIMISTKKRDYERHNDGLKGLRGRPYKTFLLRNIYFAVLS